MCGRGGHEKAYGELKSGFAFASVPSMQYAANSAWQLLSVLAFNLMRSFQLATTAGAGRRRASGGRSSPSRRSTRCVRSASSAPGVLVHPAGRAPRSMSGSSPPSPNRFERLDRLLAA